MYFTGYPAPESPMNLIKASLGILLLAGSLLTSPASEAGLMGKTLGRQPDRLHFADEGKRHGSEPLAM